MRTVVWQVILLLLMWMKTVMLQVLLLQLLWMREELQLQQSNCPGAKLWSRRSWFKFPLLHCVVHVSLEGAEREAPQPPHLGGDEAVTVTMLVVLLDDFSLTFSDNTTGEDNMLTIVLSDNNNTTCNLGFTTSVLTECVRAHDVMSEFFVKFPDHKNVTFEDTDSGPDRSHESLGAVFNEKEKGKHTVDDCVMYCGDWEGQQRQARCPCVGLMASKNILSEVYVSLQEVK